MIAFLIAEISGWLIAALVAITVALPYLLRGRVLAPNGWGGLAYRQRLRPHYWIGYAIAGLGLVHAAFAMSGSLPWSGPYVVGVWIATAGMLLAFVQVALGIELRARRGTVRLGRRPSHLGVGVTLVAVGAVHLLLNGALVRSIIAVVI